MYRSGVEEALYLCGAIAIVVQLLMWSNGRNEALGVALVAAAVLFVGWRLLNPLFTTIAVAIFSLAVALSGGSLFGDGMNTVAGRHLLFRARRGCAHRRSTGMAASFP